MKTLLPLFLFCFLSTFTFQAQEKTEEPTTKISAIFNNYFELEREAIHLHLNKTDFLTSEKIWFKGYIIDRKTKQLYFSTNIFVLLYNEKGEKISEQLVFGTNGFFQGNFELDNTLPSGRYYLQVYTNWMNNFNEDESVLRKINIINPEEGYRNYKKINYESLTLKINPEGGKFIKGITNTVGIQVNDCNGNSPENQEVKLITTSGEVVSTLKLNAYGFGKIAVLPSEEKLKFIVSNTNTAIEKQLPEAVAIGVGMDVNSYTTVGKTLLRLQINTSTSKLFETKQLFLVFHQDEKSTIIPVVFPKENSIALSIDNKELFEGINTIRIIDADLNEYAQRLIYVEKELPHEIVLNKNHTEKQGISINGISDLKESLVSVSVLPNETLSISEQVSIKAGLNVNPYVLTPIKNNTVFLNTLTRAKKYDLDLELINQEHFKYDLNFMKINVPKANFTFDVGLELKGTIKENLATKSAHKVKALSYTDFISKIADVSETGDYSFQQLAIADGTYLDLSLVKLPNFEKIPTNLQPQVINRNRPFYKKPRIDPISACPFETITYDFPKFNKNMIILLEVIVENNTKKALKYDKILGNGNLRAFKIQESDLFSSLLLFIERNGFVVFRNLGEIRITNRFGSTALPLIRIDNVEVTSLIQLDVISMLEVDEIYLSPHAIVPGMNNRQGIINIYLKKPVLKKDNSKAGFKFFVENGFKNPENYDDPSYSSKFYDGFVNFGCINWIPNLYIDGNGNFNFKIKDYAIDNAKVLIEGITFDGTIISYETELKVN